MRAGDVELVNPDGHVVATGQLGEGIQVPATAVALTACADLGDELLLIELGPAPERVLQFYPPAHAGWPDL